MLDAVSLADKARDARDWSRAAELYEAALERHPQRADLVVQWGHALKESGRLAEAEASYRGLYGILCEAALIKRP